MFGAGIGITKATDGTIFPFVIFTSKNSLMAVFIGYNHSTMMIVPPLTSQTTELIKMKELGLLCKGGLVINDRRGSELFIKICKYEFIQK